MTVWTPEEIGTATAQAAAKTGADPIVLLATFYQESGLDPSAVGDNGTSFGLEMLHEGGALGSHTPAWALNPANAITDAASRLATAKDGADVAAIQRPLNPTAYAASVDKIIAELRGAQSSASTSAASSAAPGADGVLAAARAELGTPYKFGGDTPAGFDCSGLVQYAFKQVGVNLPRTSYAQAAATSAVAASSVQPGDLIFWDADSHVGIASGNGNVIHAPHTGGVVEEIPIWSGGTVHRVAGINNTGNTNVSFSVPGASSLGSALSGALGGVLNFGKSLLGHVPGVQQAETAASDAASLPGEIAALPGQVESVLTDVFGTVMRYVFVIAIVVLGGVLLVMGARATVGEAQESAQ